MKFPKKLKIGGHWFNILFPYKFKERSDYSSQFDINMGEIRISGVNKSGIWYADSRLKEALLTEIIRACINIYFQSNDEISGKIVTGLANGWYQLFADNPTFAVSGNIPSILRIAGHNIEVKYPYLFNERTDICGRAYINQNCIQLAGVDDGGNKMLHSRVWSIFVHEINHYIMSSYCNGEKDKESIIEAIAQGLYQVFIDNKLDFNGPIIKE